MGGGQPHAPSTVPVELAPRGPRLRKAGREVGLQQVPHTVSTRSGTRVERTRVHPSFHQQHGVIGSLSAEPTAHLAGAGQRLLYRFRGRGYGGEVGATRCDHVVPCRAGPNVVPGGLIGQSGSLSASEEPYSDPPKLVKLNELVQSATVLCRGASGPLEAGYL